MVVAHDGRRRHDPRPLPLLFLQAFYKALREHLEQRQLFGDRRENKHYAQQEEES